MRPPRGRQPFAKPLPRKPHPSLRTPSLSAPTLPSLSSPRIVHPLPARPRHPPSEVWPCDTPPPRPSAVFRRRPPHRRRPRFLKLDTPNAAVVLQGHCRMPWWVGLRTSRFLRLAGSTLECFDQPVRHRLWSVVLQGARVRIHMPQHKIVLSKLCSGCLVEFFVPDDHSCRLWAAALLRASMSMPPIDTIC